MPISITQALDHIYTQTPVVDDEWIPIEESVGRVIAEDLVAKFDLPRFDNSAMDGYAVKCSDAGASVPCNGAIFAGDTPSDALTEGSAIKIMTGAPIPEGCDAIVPVEAIQVDNDKIILPQPIPSQCSPHRV